MNSILLTFLQNVACFSWTASLQSFLDKHAGEKDPNTRRGCAAEAHFAEIPQTAVRSWPSCESASNGGLIQQLKKKGISDSDPAEKREQRKQSRKRSLGTRLKVRSLARLFWSRKPCASPGPNSQNAMLFLGHDGRLLNSPGSSAVLPRRCGKDTGAGQKLHRPERLSEARASTGPVADAFPCSGPGCQGVVEASLSDGLVAPGDTCQARVSISAPSARCGSESQTKQSGHPYLAGLFIDGQLSTFDVIAAARVFSHLLDELSWI